MLTEITASSTHYPGKVKVTVYANGLDYATSLDYRKSEVVIDSLSCQYLELQVGDRTIFRCAAFSHKDAEASVTPEDSDDHPDTVWQLLYDAIEEYENEQMSEADWNEAAAADEGDRAYHASIDIKGER